MATVVEVLNLAVEEGVLEGWHADTHNGPVYRYHLSLTPNLAKKAHVLPYYFSETSVWAFLSGIVVGRADAHRVLLEALPAGASLPVFDRIGY